MYLEYLAQLDKRLPASIKKSKYTAESPLYSRRHGLLEVVRSQKNLFETKEILQSMCGLTDLLLGGPGPYSLEASSMTGRQKEAQIEHIYANSLETPPADCHTGTSPNYWRHESCRLVSLIYTTAIARQIPFSEAAASLPASLFRPSASYPSPSSTISSTPPSLLYLKFALHRSNLSDCWTEMAGVLFWVTLVGGAAAKGRPEVRQWLVALAVRCSVVLAFEHRPAVIGALQRLLRVMVRLSPDAGSNHLINEPPESKGSLGSGG